MTTNLEQDVPRPKCNPIRGPALVGGTILLGLVIAAPVTADDLRPLCPDRPGKGTSPRTVDPGHFQLEVDAFDGAYQRSRSVTTDTYAFGNPTLKYGLTDDLDIEASLAPYETVRTHDGLSDSTVSGIGDLYLRGKWNFRGNDDGPFATVLEPFLKIPTAVRPLGNGAVEGGLVVPLGYDLGNGWSLAATPEGDLVENAFGGGYHIAAVNVVGIGRSFDAGLTLGAEIWTSQDFDPARTTGQYSFDLDAAWQSDPNLQLDGGINLGLNRDTPDAEIYIGLSRRL